MLGGWHSLLAFSGSTARTSSWIKPENVWQGRPSPEFPPHIGQHFCHDNYSSNNFYNLNLKVDIHFKWRLCIQLGMHTTVQMTFTIWPWKSIYTSNDFYYLNFQNIESSNDFYSLNFQIIVSSNDFYSLNFQIIWKFKWLLTFELCICKFKL